MRAPSYPSHDGDDRLPVATEFGSVVCVDMAGPFSTPSFRHGYTYIEVYHDVWSGLITVYFLLRKAETLHARETIHRTQIPNKSSILDKIRKFFMKIRFAVIQRGTLRFYCGNRLVAALLEQRRRNLEEYPFPSRGTDSFAQRTPPTGGRHRCDLGAKRHTSTVPTA